MGVLGLTVPAPGVLCLDADAQTGEWTWMSGSSTLPYLGSGGFYAGPGVYGTLGVPAAGNVPGSRDGASSWPDSHGNLWLFGGTGEDSTSTLGSLNDLWEFNPSAREWAWMGGSSTVGGKGGQPGVYGTLGKPAVGNVPGGRYFASSWTDSSGNFWLFGGDGFDSSGTEGSLNDLWELNPTTLEWTWIGGSSTVPGSDEGWRGVYGRLGMPAAGNVPGGRFGANSWTDSSGNLWLFGGRGFDSTGAEGYLNDLWKLNRSTGEWVWMAGANQCGEAGVYGTLGAPGAGNVPGARGLANSWTDSSGNFWLFGGFGRDSTGTLGYLNDLWEFNPSALEWAWMGGSSKADQPGVYGTLDTPATGNVPGSRSEAASWVDSHGNLWLFGGAGEDSTGTEGFLNDLWEFNPSAREWAWMGGSITVLCGTALCVVGVYGTLGTPAAGNVPGGRFWASSWTESSGNLWLFGGQGYDSNGKFGLLNDLWAYQLSAVAPNATVAPTSLTFGAQETGTSSASQPVELSNTGTATLTITSITASGDFSETNNCAGSVAANGSCTINVTFTPTAPGSRPGTLTIMDNSNGVVGSTQTVSLTGTGTSLAASLSPKTLTFGSQLLGTTSTAQAVTLSNRGTASLTIASITTSGDFLQTDTCGGNVAASGSCTIKVTFKPTEKGPRKGTLTISDNAEGSPQVVQLLGVGTVVKLSPVALSFGHQPIGTTSRPQIVTLTNIANTSLKISGIGITPVGEVAGASPGPDVGWVPRSGDFAESNNCGASVGPGASCTIRVTFAPRAMGLARGNLAISDDGGGSPQNVPLLGVGW